MRFSHKCLLKAPLDRVYELFYRIKDWPLMLSHCDRIDLIDQGRKIQHLFMTVMTGKKTETIETIRICDDNRKIKFFQPSPPKPLCVHNGSWNFIPCANGTLVESVHDIKANGVFSILIPFVAWYFFIRKNSLLTIESIRSYVEKNSVI